MCVIEEREYCIFKTLVGDRVMEVWNRKEKHQNGEWNGTPANWWLKYEPFIMGEPQEPRWIPWVDKMTHRPCWGFSVAESNYVKSKWGETDVNGSVGGYITCNGRKVYELRARDLYYAIAKAQTLIVELGEHPFNFSEPEKMIGRKIWWKDQPAKVGDHLMMDQGAIMIIYDGDVGGFNTKLNRYREDDDWLWRDTHGAKEIKDDILSPSINWFRD
jgi:hypothetical protein